MTQVDRIKSLKEILANQKRIIVRNVPGASEVVVKEDLYSCRDNSESGYVGKDRMETFTVGERPPGIIQFNRVP